MSTKYTISTIEETTNVGKFLLEPLEYRYGTPLGNALRRVLLSSIMEVQSSVFVLTAYTTNLQVLKV